MRQIFQTSTVHDLVSVVEIEQIKLEASVNGEIAIALKMATSPLLIQHFLNPADSDLRKLAFAEIVGYQMAFKSGTVFWASDIDKEFYFDENNHYTVDPEDPDSYWYKMTLYETEKFNFNINYNAEIKRTMLWINAPVFDSKRTPIGLVGTGIDLTEFIDSIYSNYSESDELYFFNSSGEITGAKDTRLIENKVTLDKELGKTGVDILARARTLKPEEVQSIITSDGVICIGDVHALGWYITAIQSISLANILSSTMTLLFIAMLATMAMIFIIFNLFIVNILKPMNNMVQTLDQISTDWDLTRRLDVKQNDEVGTLGEFFNLTFEKIMVLLRDIKNKNIALSDTGAELTANMVETETSIGKISANVQSMQKRVLTQTEEVNTNVTTMERIINQLGDLNNHISLQSDSVTQSSSAIEQMLANISSVADTLNRNSGNINSLAKSSDAGRADLQKVSTDIQEIANESEGLLQINSVMQNIASQTNLLAMNAAIEAAHAGESGRGFAVVADEIRKLAENSANQSKTISAVLKKIKISIDTIIKSTSVVLERFGEIENEIGIVTNQEIQIRGAMEEQEVGSRHILDAITQLNTVTALVRNGSKEMSDESKEVLKQSADLKKITGEVSSSMDEMIDSAEHINSAVTRVNEISRENKENIGALSTEIARFKVE